MKGRLLLVGIRKKLHSSMEFIRKGYFFVKSGIEGYGVGGRGNNDKDNGMQASKLQKIIRF